MMGILRFLEKVFSIAAMFANKVINKAKYASFTATIGQWILNTLPQTVWSNSHLTSF